MLDKTLAAVMLHVSEAEIHTTARRDNGDLVVLNTRLQKFIFTPAQQYEATPAMTWIDEETFRPKIDLTKDVVPTPRPVTRLEDAIETIIKELETAPVTRKVAVSKSKKKP